MAQFKGANGEEYALRANMGALRRFEKHTGKKMLKICFGSVRALADKSEDEIAIIREAGRYVAEVLQILVNRLRPGLVGRELDEIVRAELACRNGAQRACHPVRMSRTAGNIDHWQPGLGPIVAAKCAAGLGAIELQAHSFHLVRSCRHETAK